MSQQLFGAVRHPIPELGTENEGLHVWFSAAAIPGFHGSMFMVLSTESTFVVLANALPMVEPTDFTAQLTLSVILGETTREKEFSDMARMAQPFQIMGYERLSTQLEKDKSDTLPSLILPAYEGDYYNAIGNVLYCITAVEDHLLLTVKGTTRTSFNLFPYDGDTFYWKANCEWELCEKGMWSFLAPEWHKIHFKLSKEGLAEQFTWHHDPLGTPERFRNSTNIARARIWAQL